MPIVAYHQPITRPRGRRLSRSATFLSRHNSTTIEALLGTGWVRSGPRKDVPGRPLTWMTTTAFLEAFGLSHLRDLPGMDELRTAGLLEPAPSLDLRPPPDKNDTVVADEENGE